MATIFNRSQFYVRVKNRDDLERIFPYSAAAKFKDYVEQLKEQGFQPKLSRANNRFEVKIRQKGFDPLELSATSYEEAEQIVTQIESERKRGLFIDYGRGWKVTLADLLRRYLIEEAPRQKSFETTAYRINGMLEDAGHPRQDMAEILSNHRNPHPNLNAIRQRKHVGNLVRKSLDSMRWLNKPFAQIGPEDINDYIDDRCQDVMPSTVDRELDIFSAVCNMAIDTWRVHIQKSPMHGVRRPSYFNERDRRLSLEEERKLMDAAYQEDIQRSVQLRLEELMVEARAESRDSKSLYAKKAIIREARERLLPEAWATYSLVPFFQAFVQFQLMTGARRGETLSLTWGNVDRQRQTAFLPETKNGRPRKLPLRSDLIGFLNQLPEDSERVFPISIDALRNAWGRICERAGLVGDKELRIHDLRHEAISRVADTGAVTMTDLQAFSGHKDIRMLLRYAHLCTENLAKRLDEAFADKKNITIHRGVRRLRKGGYLTMKEVVLGQGDLEREGEAPEK